MDAEISQCTQRPMAGPMKAVVREEVTKGAAVVTILPPGAVVYQVPGPDALVRTGSGSILLNITHAAIPEGSEVSVVVYRVGGCWVSVDSREAGGARCMERLHRGEMLYELPERDGRAAAEELVRGCVSIKFGANQDSASAGG